MPDTLDLREAYTLTRETEYAVAQVRAGADVLERCGTTITTLVQRVRERDDYIRMLESRLVELAVPELADMPPADPVIERPRWATNLDPIVATNMSPSGLAVELRHDLDPAKVTVFHRGGTYRLLGTDHD